MSTSKQTDNVPATPVPEKAADSLVCDSNSSAKDAQQSVSENAHSVVNAHDEKSDPEVSIKPVESTESSAQGLPISTPTSVSSTPGVTTVPVSAQVPVSVPVPSPEPASAPPTVTPPVVTSPDEEPTQVEPMMLNSVPPAVESIPTPPEEDSIPKPAKVTRGKSTEMPAVIEDSTTPKPARITRRQSRGSTESTASSVDSGKAKEESPRSSRSRQKSASESSDRAESPGAGRTLRGGRTIERSESPPRTRGSRRRNAQADPTKEIVEEKSTPLKDIERAESPKLSRTPRSKRKLGVNDEDEHSNAANEQIVKKLRSDDGKVDAHHEEEKVQESGEDEVEGARRSRAGTRANPAVTNTDERSPRSKRTTEMETRRTPAKGKGNKGEEMDNESPSGRKTKGKPYNLKNAEENPTENAAVDGGDLSKTGAKTLKDTRRNAEEKTKPGAKDNKHAKQAQDENSSSRPGGEKGDKNAKEAVQEDSARPRRNADRSTRGKDKSPPRSKFF